DAGCLAPGEGGAEEGSDTGVRGVTGHPGAVHVVVAQGRRRPAGAAGPGGGQVLLGQFRRGVYVAGVGRGVLADQAGAQALPALRAGRLEPARVEIGGGPWSWPYGPVPGAR